MVTSPNKREVITVTLVPIEYAVDDKQSAVFLVVNTSTFKESDTSNGSSKGIKLILQRNQQLTTRLAVKLVYLRPISSK